MRTLRWLWFVWFLIAWSFILTGCLAFVIEHAQDYTKNRDFPETEMDYPGPEDNYLELDPEMNYVLDYMNLKPPEPEESDSIDAEHFNVRATNHRVPDTHSARTKRPSKFLIDVSQIANAFHRRRLDIDPILSRRMTSNWHRSEDFCCPGFVVMIMMFIIIRRRLIIYVWIRPWLIKTIGLG